MANKIYRESEKNVVETLKEIRLQPNMECGVDEIEFPDGTKEKFFYNGEADREAAVKFATICVNATSNTPKAKTMMATCFWLMANNVKPERIVVLEDGRELYLDVDKKALYNSNGTAYVELTDGEKETKMSADVLAMLLKERAERKAAYNRNACYDCDDCDGYDDCDDCDRDDCDEEEDW